MSHLALYLFGGFHAELDGRPLTNFATDKNRALLAYLALESDRPHRREALATLLWPNRPDCVARSSLRQALYLLRKTLAEASESEPHLLIDDHEVQFNRASDYWIDADEFRHHVAVCRAHHPSFLSLCAACCQRLQAAFTLCVGDLLDGFTLPHCNQFSDWQIITQEASHREVLAVLSLLADYYEANHEYDQLIACAERAIELEPWREAAYRRLMWALAMTGERARALRRYEALSAVLERELGVCPEQGTRQLYAEIRDGTMARSSAGHGTLLQDGMAYCQGQVAAAAPFAGRQAELDRLREYLIAALAGQGKVAFVSGEAGSGKSTVLNEFARRTLEEAGDLLVATGSCNSRRGVGDAYQPFREVLGTLAGTAALSGCGTMIAPEAAWRLRSARPVLLQLVHGACPWLDGRLAVDSFWGRSDMCDQATKLLLAISRRFPLLILLDDLQWLDTASASLLFHLGLHIAGSRVLLVGAYRPEDVTALGPARHPLVAIRHEFRRRFGEIEIDLSQSDGWTFVNSLVDAEPNRLDDGFRETLYGLTGGNALFTVELLHAMQERGELGRDGCGRWVQQARSARSPMPARVEAVIAERVSRLDNDCRMLLAVASIQGDVFDADAVAGILGRDEEEVVATLSSRLCREHLLVSPLRELDGNAEPQARYQFCCSLLRDYLLRIMDDVERRRLKRATARAREPLPPTQPEHR